MIIGYIDYLIFGILIFLNIKYWKRKFNWIIGFLLGGILFGLILPVISLGFEISRVKMTIGIEDNFEVLYTYLRFPMYWAIGLFQLIFIGITLKERKIGPNKMAKSHVSEKNASR
jgi:hypothetical protein